MKTVFLPTVLICFSCCYAQLATGNLIRTFDDPKPTGLDFFGASVAIDGNRLLVGAPGDQNAGYFVGQAYLLDASTGSLLQTFDDPTITSEDYFGNSVAVDGNFVVIGARGDDTNFPNGGQAHVFDVSTGSLLYTLDDPTSHYHDSFGLSVALQGNHLLIGERDQAHLFDVTTGSHLHTFNGSGRSIAEDYVAIVDSADSTNGQSVGQVHLFDVSTYDLIHTFIDPTITGNDYFGSSVAIDGNQVLVGAVGDDTYGKDFGQVHLFDAVSGSLLQTYDYPAVDIGSHSFGSAVAIDGNKVVVGAPLYDTGYDPETGHVSATNVGRAFVFDAMTGELLNILDDPTITGGDWFGGAVAVDRNRVIVGAPEDKTIRGDVGQVHLFEIIVPEPSTTILLLGIGLIGMSGLARMRPAIMQA